MKRRAALLLAVTAACGSSSVTVTTTGPVGSRPFRDLPDVPHRTPPVELPSQYEIPAVIASPARTPRVSARASRGGSARGRVSAAPGPSGAATLDVFDRLAECESRHRNLDTGNGYFGYFQFIVSTWRSLGLAGLPTDHSYEVQRDAAVRLVARSGWSQFPRCARKLGMA